MAQNNDRRLQEDINSLRQQEVDITNQLMSLRTTLASITERDAANLERIRTLTQKILELEGRSSDIATQIVDINGQILSTQEEIVDTMEEQRDTSDDLLDNDRTRLLLSEKQKKIYDQIDDVYDSSVDHSKKLLENQNLTEGGASRINDILQSSSTEQRVFNSLLESDVSNRNDILKAMKASAGANRELVSLEESILNAQEAASKGRLELIDISQAENALKEVTAKLTSRDIEMSAEARGILEAKAKMLQEGINLANEQNNISKEAIQSYETSNELLSGIFDKISSGISKLPGGSFLMKHLGFDKMKDNIMNNMGGALKTVMDGFSKGGLVGGMQSLAPAARAFGMALMAGPQVIIFGIMAAVGGLIALFMDADKEVSELGKELGISKKEALGVHEAAADLAAEMNVVGVNAKEIGKGIKTVSESLGGIDIASRFAAGDEKIQGMVKNAAILTEKFGMSGEEVGNLQGLASATGVSVEELSMKATSIGKGIFSAKENMKILASIPKTMAASFKGNVDSMIKMAQQAKLLGLDMKKIEETGRRTLDIEGSLEAEMEARVLTGKDINLDAMRYAALHNDQATVMKELVKNAGTYSEFKEMDAVQQESLAKAMNMSKEEMIDMLQKQEDLSKAGLDFNEVQKLQEQGSAKIREEIAKTTDEEKRKYLERLAGETESEEAAKGFSDLLEKIKGLAVKIVAPLMEMVDAFMKGETASDSVLGTVGGIFGFVGDLVKVTMSWGKIIMQMVIWPFKLLWSIISPIIDYVKEIFSVFSDGGDVLGGVSSIFDTIAGVMSTIQDVITGIVSTFISGLLEPSKIFYKALLMPIWEAFKGVWSVITGIYDQIVKAFEPLFKANEAAEDTVSFMDTIKKVMSAITPIVTIIGEAIGKFIIRPFQMIADLVGMVIKIFTGDFEGALGDLGGLIFDTFIGIPKIIWEAVSGIIDAIFGTNLKESVTGFFDWMKDAFKTVYKLISPLLDTVMEIGGYLADYLIQPFKTIWGIVEGLWKMLTGDFMGGLEQIGSSIMDQILSPFELIKNIFSSIYDFIVNDLVGAIADIVPDWLMKGIDWLLGGGGGEETKAAEETKKGGSVELPSGEMPKAAAGGTVNSGGLVLVGEKGPELVQLPMAATVASTSATDQAGSILRALGLGGATDGEGISGESQSNTANQGSVTTVPTSAEGGGFIDTLMGIGETAMGAVTSTAGNVVGGILGGGADNSMAKVEQKLDTLINVLSAATSTPTVIKFGDKVVDEIKTQLNFRKAYTGTDIAYGKTLGN